MSALLGFVGLVTFAINPVNQPFSMPDVNVVVIDNTAYAFCGTDVRPFEDLGHFDMPYWRCFSSRDLINWTFESCLYPTGTYMGESDKCFAGHAVERGGKWFWYFSDYTTSTGVVVGDSPKGPWKDVLGTPLLPAGLTDTREYDPCVFIDGDGQGYITFGAHKNREMNYYIAALNEDMVSLKETPRKLVVEGVPKGSGYLAGDASFLHKHNGLYYLSWRRPYAVAETPYGPYRFVGRHQAQGHGGFFDFNNQNFVNYTSLKEGYRLRYRFCSLGYVHYTKDGAIAPMEPLVKEFGVGAYKAHWPAIEAEWFMAMPDGPRKVEREGGGFEIENLQQGDYLYFPNISNVPRDAVVEVTYSCGNSKGGKVLVRAYNHHGPIIGEAFFDPTGGWGVQGNLAIALDKNPPGEISFSLVVEGAEDVDLIHIDSFRILNSDGRRGNTKRAKNMM